MKLEVRLESHVRFQHDPRSSQDRTHIQEKRVRFCFSRDRQSATFGLGYEAIRTQEIGVNRGVRLACEKTTVPSTHRQASKAEHTTAARVWTCTEDEARIRNISNSPTVSGKGIGLGIPG